MNQSDHLRVGEWLAQHPEVKHEPLVGRNEQGGRRYRFGHLSVSWYPTGTVMVQGVGVGSLVFKHLNCKTCQQKPIIIQALEYMVRQVEKHAALLAKNPEDRLALRRRLDHKLRDRHYNV